MKRRIAQEREFGVSMWAVERMDTGELVGLCGFFPSDGPEMELGYVVHAEHWGKGYATEAVSAALEAARRAGFKVWATIRSTNAASLAVARKVNLVQQDVVIEANEGPC